MKVNARKLIEIDFNQLSHYLLARFKIQQWCWWQFLSPKSKQSLFESKFWNLKVNYFFMRGPFILWALYQHLFDVWVVTRFLCGFIPRLNLLARVNIDRGSSWSTKDWDESVFQVPAHFIASDRMLHGLTRQLKHTFLTQLDRLKMETCSC